MKKRSDKLKDGIGVGEVSSVVISSGDHLFAGGSENDCVLKLGSVSTPGVTEGWIGIHKAFFAEVTQGQEVFGLTEPVHPPTAEGKGAEVFVNCLEKLLRTIQSAYGRRL